MKKTLTKARRTAKKSTTTRPGRGATAARKRRSLAGRKGGLASGQARRTAVRKAAPKRAAAHAPMG